MKPYNIESKNLLVISDVHQDIAWAETILTKEKGNYDSVVFLGDFFDSFWEHPDVATVTQTAEFVRELINGRYGPAYLCLGNHDAGYMEGWRFVQQHHSPLVRFNMCSGYTKNKSKDINKVFSWQDWRKFHLFFTCQGYLFSHAGVASGFWSAYKTEEENLDKLHFETEEALDLISIKPSPYFAVGYGRGGPSVYGGLTWQDWDTEFKDTVPMPQIVGHSSVSNLVRKCGNSYCIDGNQNIYVLIKEGKIEFKSTNPSINFRDDTNKSTIVENWKY